MNGKLPSIEMQGFQPRNDNSTKICWSSIAKIEKT